MTPSGVWIAERHAVHQAVRHVNGMNGEDSSLEALVGAHLAQVGVVEQAMLVEFVFHVGEGELGAPDRNFKFGKKPRQRADVVFMAVRQDDSAHALAVFDEIRNVRDHDVDAKSSASGNMSPASMTIMSSPKRTAMQFIPNSPRPPRGMICSFPVGIE
jgi:hypothetical protein